MTAAVREAGELRRFAVLDVIGSTPLVCTQDASGTFVTSLGGDRQQ